MNKKICNDLIFGVCILILVLPFLCSDAVYDAYSSFNVAHPYITAYIKFAILATIGEMLGLRIKSGSYLYKGFGIAPRAIIWGLYGIWIAIAMKTFALGSPQMVDTLGIKGVAAAMKEPFSALKLIGAFSISVMMNTVFAPVFMTLHKVTDTHISDNGGSICSLFRPIPMKKIIPSLNWEQHWSFVIKKTIPIFWIPAHTITFLLPATSQVLFAALLSIALGVFLSIGVVLSRKK